MFLRLTFISASLLLSSTSALAINHSKRDDFDFPPIGNDLLYPDPGTYHIINNATGTCVDLYNGGTEIVGWPCEGGASNPHQVWQIVKQGTINSQAVYGIQNVREQNWIRYNGGESLFSFLSDILVFVWVVC